MSKSSSLWDNYDDDLEETIKITRVILEMPPEMHREIKSRAATRGITLKKYIMRALLDRIRKEKLEEE